ncbi:alpha/beta fold hydrolase [Nocardia sp. SYP-A9097]|uniref:alpha/beta fold hydrolase n=1 Tax=Nocardia sp. SYP-A9097 TaxID=2663237 RepID=UPI00129BC87A|nr:alpha/beta hydrolase [Nocardia sp. SYP-A9097]MRH91335.1 alpha/beta fold hydrolase [Nocardia sp. SYP-A9097]
MPLTIPDFDYQRITVGDGVTLNVAIGGAGQPVVLLHGFPQTHLAWRHIATDLAADHLVVCPDLRGYGASDKPLDDEAHTVYSKRTMAADIVELLAHLGHRRFAVAGHDRGAVVAFRAGLDHPDLITHAAFLDVVPSLDIWPLLTGQTGVALFHIYFMAHPAPLPETLIHAAPEAYLGYFLDLWATDPEAIPRDIRTAYLAASMTPDAIAAICADYRSGATTDIRHDAHDRAAGRQLTMPTAALWTPTWPFDPAPIWHSWTTDLRTSVIPGGHLLPEDRPTEVTTALRELLST